MLRVGHDWATSLSLFTFMHWRRKWQPTPVFLLGESQGRGAWWAAIYGVAQSGHDWSDLAAAAAVNNNYDRHDFLWFVVVVQLLSQLQYARLPCPSLSPGVCSNSRLLSQWCHPTISSSVIPFSSCLHSFPASGCFPMSQFFTSGGQSIGVSASASVLPMNSQDWSPLGWTGWISLQSKGLSRVFSNTTVQKHQFFGTRLSL